MEHVHKLWNDKFMKAYLHNNYIHTMKHATTHLMYLRMYDNSLPCNGLTKNCSLSYNGIISSSLLHTSYQNM